MTEAKFRGLCAWGMLLTGLVLACSAQAADEIILESTITGSQEQPKVISIVPWQEPPRVEAMYEDVHSVIEDEVMQPIDRDMLTRQANYHLRLHRQAPQASPSAPQ